jgi:Na+-driven multidrug efflux pump
MQAMQPLLGYNSGSGSIERVRGILIRVLVTTVAMGVIFCCVVAAFARPVAALFSRSDLALIDMVASGLPWFVLPLVLFGLSGTLAHYFLSVHQPKKAAILLLGRQLLAIPLFFVLPRWRGFPGVYLVGPCADIPFMLIAGWLLTKELRYLNQQCQARHRPNAISPVQLVS